MSEPDLTQQLKAVADAEHALDDARDKLKLSTILAPADGRVVSTAVITGAAVQPQAPVLQLAIPDANEVEADLTEAQVQQLSPSQPVTITLYAKDIVLQPDAFWVNPGQIELQGGQSFLWLRKVIDLGIVKIPRDRRVPVTIGAKSADKIEILHREQLGLCQDQGAIDSNRDIPDGCSIIVAPPAQ